MAQRAHSPWAQQVSRRCLDSPSQDPPSWGRVWAARELSAVRRVAALLRSSPLHWANAAAAERSRLP
jgi:hypothetical protein